MGAHGPPATRTVKVLAPLDVRGVQPHGGEPVARIRKARVRRASTAQLFVFDESDAY